MCRSFSCSHSSHVHACAHAHCALAEGACQVSDGEKTKKTKKNMALAKNSNMAMTKSSNMAIAKYSNFAMTENGNTALAKWQ